MSNRPPDWESRYSPSASIQQTLISTVQDPHSKKRHLGEQAKAYRAPDPPGGGGGRCCACKRGLLCSGGRCRPGRDALLESSANADVPIAGGGDGRACSGGGADTGLGTGASSPSLQPPNTSMSMRDQDPASDAACWLSNVSRSRVLPSTGTPSKVDGWCW